MTRDLPDVGGGLLALCQGEQVGTVLSYSITILGRGILPKAFL
jgi:hypothetical protein